MRFTHQDRQNTFAFCPNNSPLRIAVRVLHCWNTGFGATSNSPPAVAGGSVRNCNLPSACASGSGKLAAIQTVSSSSSSLDSVVFGHSADFFTFAEPSGTMLCFLSIFPARTAFPLLVLSREVSRLAPAACSTNRRRWGRDSRPTAGFIELSFGSRRMTLNA